MTKGEGTSLPYTMFRTHPLAAANSPSRVALLGRATRIRHCSEHPCGSSIDLVTDKDAVTAERHRESFRVAKTLKVGALGQFLVISADLELIPEKQQKGKLDFT